MSGLSGPIPSDLGGLSELYQLGLDDNEFTSIPDSFSQLSKLRILFLRNNSITGSIPSWISPSMYMLVSYLGNACSKIGSQIIVTFEMEPSLRQDLSSNKLSGSIPESMPYGKILALNGNFLSGQVPERLTKKIERPEHVAVTTNIFDISGNCFVESDLPANRFAEFGVQKSQPECQPYLQQQPPSKPIALIAGLSVASVVAVMLVAVGVVFIIKRKKAAETARYAKNLEKNLEDVKEVKEKI
ncbi:hypothetical protein HDU97_007647 [Phlyctochytrium planicorne]|nr:hypothetical protein HDU97_007647 [Phlyctochytrium planicorne]